MEITLFTINMIIGFAALFFVGSIIVYDMKRFYSEDN